MVILPHRIDMYTEGVADLGEMILLLPLCPPNEKDAKVASIKEKSTNRYLPAFEKVSGPFSILGTEIRGQRKVVGGIPGALTLAGIPGALTFTSVSLPKS